MKSISAIINARKKSTRVPNKLLRKFSNSNLIEIALGKLNEMYFFDNRYLAVAETEFIELIQNYENVKLLKRKKEAVKRGVNEHIVTFGHYMDIKTDYIFVMNPCLPLISVETYKMAYDYFQKTDFPSYTSVVGTRDWIFNSDGQPLTNTNPNNLTTNKGKEFYKAAHAFHIVDRKFFTKNKIHWTFTKNDPHIIKIDEQEYADVDTMNEFLIAENLFNNLNK